MKSNPYLFVYGSLLHGFQSSIGQFLKNHARFIGEAYANGKIFDLGRYPGLVLSSDEQDTVYGHLLELSNPDGVFITLDRYEGIFPDDPQNSEYRRELIRLNKNTLGITTCWTYIYNYSTEGLKVIPGGNYAEFIKNSPPHQQFIDSV